MTAYPPPPWRLCGTSVQALRLVDVRRARALVRADLKIVPVVPGRTIAVVYCARYGEGSSLSYSELAVAPALVASRGRIGFWISHIYVDNPASIAGGRAIWRLPKQSATFSWNETAREVVVTDGPQTLCRMTWETRAARLRIPVLAPVLIEGPRTFWPRGSCQLTRCRAMIAADEDSPVSRLELTRSCHLLAAQELRFCIPRPRG